MMDVRKYRDNNEQVVSAWDKNGERLGFVGSERDRSNPAKTRYGIGIDNMGDPYRGVLDRELATALGNLDYGYDGDTVAAWFTPNAYAGRGNGSAWAGIGDYQLRANNLGNGGLGVGLNFPDNVNIPDYQRSFNTPLGELGIGTNDGNPNIGATFQPNDKTMYYIQALKNLLGR